MKFDCDQCGTRYNIADEKVRRKVLKIRCRVCENVITVRGADLERQSEATPPPKGPGLSPTGWFAAPAGEEIGPMALERLEALVESGEVGADALVWCDGMDDWIPVAELPALAQHLPRTSILDDEATSTFEVHDRIDDSLRQTLMSTPPPGPVPPEPAERRGMGWETDDRPTVAEPRVGPVLREPLLRDTGARPAVGPDPQRRMLIVLLIVAVFVLLGLVVAITWWVYRPPPVQLVPAPAGVPAPVMPPGGAPPAAPPAAVPPAAAPPAAAPPAAAPPAATPPAAPKPAEGSTATPPTPQPVAAAPALAPGAPPGARPLPIAPADPPEQLTPAQVQAVIDTHQPDIEACHARQLRESGPLPRREATLSFELRPSGRTREPTLDAALDGTVFGACVREAARGWRFPTFTGAPIPVQYPFVLKTAG